MIDIIYQYIAATAWQELRYSLRSIKQHFKGEYRVWIIGDLPGWVKNVNHIPHVRNNKIRLTNCYDACSKMELVINHPDITEDFIYMYDDIYLLRDITRNEIRHPLYARVDIDNILKHEYQVSKHRRMLWNTYEVLKSQGLTGWDCETHLPRLFNKSMMREILKMYDPLGNRLLFATLYFNTFFGGLPHYIRKSDNVKAGFYGTNDDYSYHIPGKAKIKELLSKKTFLNHDDRGLNTALKNVIEETFPHKCKFEK